MYRGKQALGAGVFVWGPGKKPFVGYLMRYTAEAKAQRDRSAQASGGAPTTAFLAGLEVRRPGESEWVPAMDPQNPGFMSPGYAQIASPRDANGRGASAIYPE